MSFPLDGRRVLLTRPAGYGDSLKLALRKAGAQVLHRPTLALVPNQAPLPALDSPPDWIVFVSPFAVTTGWPRLPSAWQQAARLAAVGPGSASAITARGVTSVIAPEHGGGANDLLALPDFNPQAGQTVLIVCGKKGRQQLQQTLRSWGIHVVEAVVYDRQPAAEQLVIPEEWQQNALDFLIVTSAAGLEYLLGMAGPSALQWLKQSRLVTVSERLAQAALMAGFTDPLVAAGADDAALLAVLSASPGSRK
ncbi:MAG: uroporphyrinogen-III synthase [Gammaproteobacteria bacterium]|nr:uroporphyrinogen-III synthase [Gammaproteobacteria bacterium]